MLSEHPNLCIEWIYEFQNKDWNWKLLQKSKNFYNSIDIHILRDFANKDWDWKFILSLHPNLKLEWIIEFPDKNWFWDLILSMHQNLTIEWLRWILKNKYSDNDCDWDMRLSTHHNLTIEWLIEFPDKDWDWKELSVHPNFTLEWIRKFPNKFKLFNDSSIQARFLFMTENIITGTSLNKEIMENVWSPKNVLRYNGKYFDYLEGEEYYY